MPGGQLSCFARNGGAAARGRKLNVGIAASRARRSRCPARSSHHRDPNGRAARNRNSARRSRRPHRHETTHAPTSKFSCLLQATSRIPEDKRRQKTPCHRDLSRPESAARRCHRRSIGPAPLARSRLKNPGLGPAPIRIRIERYGIALVTSGLRRRRLTIVPVFRARAIRRAGLPRVVPRPSSQSRPRRSRRRPAARDRTSW